MKHFAICLPLAVLLITLGGCASTVDNHKQDAAPVAAEDHDADSDAEADAKKAADQQSKVEELTHKLMVARIQLDLAVLAGTRSELEQERRILHAQGEVQMAEASLQNFMTVEMPGKLGRAKLSLQSTREYAMEADEELQQIELMYKEQNLADMTSEFVIERGRRRAARAAKRIEFQELDLKSLETHELPMQQQKLTLAVTKKQEALEAAQADTAKIELNRTLKLSQAKMAVKKATEALKKAETKTEETEEEEDA